MNPSSDDHDSSVPLFLVLTIDRDTANFGLMIVAGAPSFCTTCEPSPKTSEIELLRLPPVAPTHYILIVSAAFATGSAGASIAATAAGGGGVLPD